MQVEFPSKHLPTRSTSSSGYTVLQKLNANENAISDSFIHNELFNDHSSNIHRIPINSRDSNSSSYKFHQSIDDPIIPLRRQRLHEAEYKRSNSPALSDIMEEDHLGSSVRRSATPTLSFHTDSSTESSIFPRDFNSEVFYQSVFQPEIFTDDRHQPYIEMKLDIHDYNPDKIKISINNDDLIVHIEDTKFYKQITLPSNTDFTSLSIHYHHDKKLYITVKLFDEYSSFKYI
jgi:hypothetical protein